MISEVGAFEIEVPRDRAGSFTPRLVRKGQRRLDGLDSMIISLYAGGMTVRDIRHHLASTLGVEVSAATISTITAAKSTVSTTCRNLSDALPCSRTAFKTVGQKAIPFVRRNAFSNEI